nr:hypothetical protein [Sphingobium sp. YR768]
MVDLGIIQVIITLDPRRFRPHRIPTGAHSDLLLAQPFMLPLHPPFCCIGNGADETCPFDRAAVWPHIFHSFDRCQIGGVISHDRIDRRQTLQPHTFQPVMASNQSPRRLCARTRSTGPHDDRDDLTILRDQRAKTGSLIRPERTQSLADQNIIGGKRHDGTGRFHDLLRCGSHVYRASAF